MNRAFEKELAAGYDVLYLGFSSGLSGSFNTSCIARDSVMEKYPEGKIICIDSSVLQQAKVFCS